MLNTIQNKLDRLQETAEEKVEATRGRFGSQPDGLNESIGKTENAMAFAAAIAATFLVRHALQATWRTTLDREPPKNPASSEVQWREALLWGAVSGAIVGATRIASRRASSSAYRKLAHSDRRGGFKS